ncbi:MAG: hypothetical protein D6722_17125 [Bacteroidetes bacterium]|nr:MAG: hypothetical protein D6722_17125 [Bacteroidota bacterium]
MFEEGVPDFPEIKRRFEKQTGLPLELLANLNVCPISADPQVVIGQLANDLESVANLFDPQLFMEGPVHAHVPKRDAFSHLNNIRFFTPGFYPIFFNVQGHIIEIEYLLGNYYFPSSLKKVLIEAGGKVLNIHNEMDQNWVAPVHWKKLRPWHTYYWFNRPRK